MPEETLVNETSGNAENSPMGFSPITSQEEFDAAIKKRLERAEKSFEEKNKAIFEKAKAFDELEEQNKSELQKAQEKIADLEGQLNERQLLDQIESWKSNASKETGVPIELIRGNTEEEINAHAEALKPHFSNSGFVGSDGFAPNQSPKVSTSEAFGRAVNEFF